MEGIVNYTYRGVLKACNSSCRYCPFSKTAADAAPIAADREALFRFCDYIARLRRAPRSLQIFLLPYGEGMIHPHYTEALARLSRLPAVRRVSCQTSPIKRSKHKTELSFRYTFPSYPGTDRNCKTAFCQKYHFAKITRARIGYSDTDTRGMKSTPLSPQLYFSKRNKNNP